MDIARDICTDSFYIVNSGLPCIAVTAVLCKLALFLQLANKGSHLERKVQFFFNIVQTGGGVIPIFKNYVVNFV